MHDAKLHERLTGRALPTAGGCWEWQGRRTYTGYGMVGIYGRGCTAHRAMVISLHGPIAPELQVDHLCRNRACVNPAHLEVVTAAENSRRARAFRLRTVADACKYGHPLDGTRTRDVGGRYCRTCINDRKRRYRAARKAG